MKIVYRAANPLEAHIVAGMLQSEGINAHASGTLMQGGVGELPASDYAMVRVPAGDVQRARELIQDYDAGAVPSSWDAADDHLDPAPSADVDQAGWTKVALFLAILALCSLVVVSWFA